MFIPGSAQRPVGYGLPNDLRVQNAVGARTATYGNILQSSYQSTFRPIADAVLDSSDQANLQFSDILDEILMVRLFDSLGVVRKYSITRQRMRRSIRDAGRPGLAWHRRYTIRHVDGANEPFVDQRMLATDREPLDRRPCVDVQYCNARSTI